MTEQEYLEVRVNDQITWYNKKSGTNKKYHQQSKALIIVFSALIPFATGYNEVFWMNYLIGLLGVLILSLIHI